MGQSRQKTLYRSPQFGGITKRFQQQKPPVPRFKELYFITTDQGQFMRTSDAAGPQHPLNP